MKYDIFIPIEPQPWRRARKQGKRHFRDNKSNAYRKAVIFYVSQHIKTVTDKAVRADMIFAFTIPKSWPKYKKENPPRHISTPDKDNLEKGIMDALEGIVWKDDAQLDSGDIIKKYSNNPGIYLKIETE